MITRSFIFLERIGEKTERKLWNLGITSWYKFLEAPEIPGIALNKKHQYDIELKIAERRLANLQIEYFIQRLPHREHWRLFEYLKNYTVYLDIETTGMSRYSPITVVGIFDGKHIKTFVRDINLSSSNLKNALSGVKQIITFNGACFDLPILRTQFPYVLPKNLIHLDLRFLARRLGLTGGLKRVEQRLGITRNERIQSMNGDDAVILWLIWERERDINALKLLIEYNRADVINLRLLANIIYRKLVHRLIARA
jgi:hypothetical protein